MTRHFVFTFLMALATISVTAQKPWGSFEAIPYAHPDESHDLGVGLWAWPLPMDYDLDGDMDLLVSCTDVPFNGLYLFENQIGDKIPVFEAPVKLGEGLKDLQISYVDEDIRVMGRGVEYRQFRDALLSDPEEVYSMENIESMHEKIRFRQSKWVDYEGDGDQDLIVGMDDWGDYGWDDAYDDEGNWTNGPLHGYVYLVKNNDGDLKLDGRIQAGGKDLDVYGAPTPNFADFDGDGDLDIICGEFLDRFTWFENTGTRSEPRYAEGRLLTNEEGVVHMDLQMIIPVAVDWDQDGHVDLVVGDEDGRVALVRNTGKVSDHMPVFAKPYYFQQRGGNVKFGALVTPAATDWDGDGDDDLVCGNTAGYIGVIENEGTTDQFAFGKPKYLKADGKEIRVQAGSNGSIQGPCEAKWGYTTLSVADWDGDGLQDILSNSIWGKVEWYRNTGSQTQPQLASAQPLMVAWEGEAPKPAWNWWNPAPHELATQWRTVPYAMDWNNDGAMDLVMLDHEGYLAWFERKDSDGRNVLLPGKRVFTVTNASVFDSKNRVIDSIPGTLRLNGRDAGSSGRKKFVFVDWDGDGDQDLLVNSVNIDYFEQVSRDGDEATFFYHGPISDQVLAGHTTSPTFINEGGAKILVVGAEDGHFYEFVPEDEEE